MLELGQNDVAATGADDVIRDATDETFMAEVVDASAELPVIVDFWAPWCGPCKTLGPMLEEATRAAGGKVRMIKINVDENPQVSAQLRIQSIPTVYAFYEGKPVDGFQGALPGSEITAFVDRVAALAGDGGLGEAIEAAQAMLDEGAAEDAAQTFEAILGEEPSNAAAYAGLAQAHIAMGDLDQAEAIINGASAEIAGKAEIEAAHAQLALARQASDAGPVAELKAKIDENPDDHQSRLELATALHAAGNVEEAVDQLLELFRRDRNWNDEAAKTQLFTIFEALKANDPVALNGRRRLSSMIFS